MRVRKKPVEVEARLLTEENSKEIAEWCGGLHDVNDLTAEPSIKIYTLEGVMTAMLGDYIIKGVAGEFYPCKPTIFNNTYDIVEEKKSRVPKIEVLSLTDLEDGGAYVTFDMDHETMKLFATIGLRKALVDEANRILEENRSAEDEIDINVGC